MDSIGGSISSLLGIGSGIDTSAIVTQLVAATREPRAVVLNDRVTLNNTRISALASASSSLDTFSKALTETLGNGSFVGQPVSNDPSIVAISSLPGGSPTGLPAQIEVRQLAAAQVLESPSLASKTTPVGLGTLTLTTAAGSFPITIDSTSNTLEGLAKKINDSNAGVTASIVTDNRGARLVVKGATGDANTFTLANAGDADADLLRFAFTGANVPGAMTKTQSAADSIVFIDNVEMQNDTNVLKDAIPYVRIDLNKAVPGTLVTLASDQPEKTVKDLVKEFVDGYNSLRSALNTATAVGKSPATSGALAGDAAIREMTRQLGRITTTALAGTGAYKTLNDIGVSTNQDGTLKLDSAKLDAAVAADPAGVTQMLNPTTSTASNPGLAAVVKSVRDSLLKDDDPSQRGPLAAAKARYETLRTELTKQVEKLDSDMTDYEEKLSVVYSRLDGQLAAFKATQSYLKQQVDLWTKSDS